MSNDLLNKKCVPCEGGVDPLSKEQVIGYLAQVPGWEFVPEANPKPEQARFGARLRREYKFKDFIGAINFINNVAELAESESHHPDIHINYNKVLLELWTHAIGGLHDNDFILAAKIDASK